MGRVGQVGRVGRVLFVLLVLLVLCLECGRAGTPVKHIGSASLLEWAEMIDILDNRKRLFFFALRPEAALPAFKPAKKTRK